MNCYTCTQNLCTIYLDCENNATIDLGYPAPFTGEYILHLQYQNISLSFTKMNLQQGDNLFFNLSRLNEDYCYSFFITGNGKKIFVNNGAKSYDNFTFCTRQEWKIS